MTFSRARTAGVSAGALFLIVAALFAWSLASAQTASATHVDPIEVVGNDELADCERAVVAAGLSGVWFGVKANNAAVNGDYSLPGGGTVTISNSDGFSFDWDSTVPLDAVFVKAGTGANLYLYDSETSRRGSC